MTEMGRKPKPTERQESWGAEYTELWLSFPLCGTCSRKMRPPRGTALAYPETVSRVSALLCQSCYLNGGRRELQREARRKTLLDRSSVLAVASRRLCATAWSPAQSSAALLVCGALLSAEAAEVLEQLGLFAEPERGATPTTDLSLQL